jgi:hypothetical protein
VAPDNRRCDCISKALAYSVTKEWIESDMLPNSHKEAMTPEEIQEALQEAKERGLPAGWKVKWNSKKHQKQWIAPKTGKICNSVPDALKVSVKLGLLEDMPPKTAVKRKRKQSRIISPKLPRQPALDQLVDAALVNDLQRLVDQEDGDEHDEDFEWNGYDDDDDIDHQQQPVPPSQQVTAALPTTSTNCGSRILSQHEITAALEEARARGLPDGWQPVWDMKRKRRAWISPCGKHRSKGIPSALQKSVDLGMIEQDKAPPSYAKRTSLGKELTTELREAIGMRQAKERGLPDGWTCKWNAEQKARRWISPDERIAKGLNEALRMSVDMGLLPRSKLPAEYRERTLTPEEQTTFLEEAQAKGLPPDWSVSWNR